MVHRMFIAQNRGLGRSCIVMPDGCAIDTSTHPRWNSNNNHYGTDNFKFCALPGGTREVTVSEVYFVDIGSIAWLWSSSDPPWFRTLNVWDSLVGRNNDMKTRGCAVRGVKDYSGALKNGDIIANDYTDGDGNTYDAVVIGNQLWTIENLYTTKYQNGADIPNVTNDTNWRNLTTGAYCWYRNNYDDYGQYYGALYNWYAISELISSNGYRVPSDADWTQLTNYLINTEWCGINITGTNVAQFLKSCRQVNHPLA